jgi:hypothetical protein
MWEPRHFTTLWAFTACYRDSFTFYRVRGVFVSVWATLVYQAFNQLSTSFQPAFPAMESAVVGVNNGYCHKTLKYIRHVLLNRAVTTDVRLSEHVKLFTWNFYEAMDKSWILAKYFHFSTQGSYVSLFSSDINCEIDTPSVNITRIIHIFSLMLCWTLCSLSVI